MRHLTFPLGLLVAAVVAASLTARTPGEERALAFVKEALQASDFAASHFSFEPHICLHPLSAFSTEDSRFTINDRNEIVPFGIVAPIPTRPLTPRGCLFFAFEDYRSNDFYTLTLTDDGATATFLPIPSHFRFSQTNRQPAAKRWALPLAQAEEIILTFDALTRLHNIPINTTYSSRTIEPGHLDISFIEQGDDAQSLTLRHLQYCSTRDPDERLSLGDMAIRPTLLKLFLCQALTPPPQTTDLPARNFAREQLQQAIDHPGSVPPQLLIMACECLTNDAADFSAHPLFERLLEEVSGCSALEALQKMANPPPFRDELQSTLLRTLAEAWIATLAEPTDEHWIALLRISSQSGALIEIATEKLAQNAPAQLNQALIDAFDRPGARRSFLWQMIQKHAPQAAFALINRPFPLDADPLLWATHYLDFLNAPATPKGVIPQHRIDELVARLVQAITNPENPPDNFADILDLLARLNRLPDNQTLLNLLEAHLALASPHTYHYSTFKNISALTRQLLKNGSRAGWEKLKPRLIDGSCGPLEVESNGALPFEDLLPVEEVRAVALTLSQRALAGNPVFLSRSDILMLIVRYRLGECLPDLQRYAADDNAPDEPTHVLTRRTWPARPFDPTPSPAIRDFLKAFPDQAALDAFRQKTAHLIPEDRLSIFSMMELIQNRECP